MYLVLVCATLLAVVTLVPASYIHRDKKVENNDEIASKRSLLLERILGQLTELEDIAKEEAVISHATGKRGWENPLVDLVAEDREDEKEHDQDTSIDLELAIGKEDVKEPIAANDDKKELAMVKEHTPNLGVLNDDEDLEATAVKKDEKEVSLHEVHGFDRKKPSIAEELEKDEQEVSSDIGRRPGQASHVEDPGNAVEKEDISYRTCATLRDLIFSNRVHHEQSKKVENDLLDDLELEIWYQQYRDWKIECGHWFTSETAQVKSKETAKTSETAHVKSKGVATRDELLEVLADRASRFNNENNLRLKHTRD